MDENFYQTSDPVLCVYNVVKLKLDVPLAKETAENYLLDWGVRDMLLSIHRRIFCWIDEWLDVTKEELDAFEARMKEFKADK